MTTQELLDRWRDATRAAELAQRLAKVAAERVEHADEAAAAEEIAVLAEQVARSAHQAAQSARRAADRAAGLAHDARARDLAEADQQVVSTTADEQAAREGYHEAERLAAAHHRDEDRR